MTDIGLRLSPAQRQAFLALITRFGPTPEFDPKQLEIQVHQIIGEEGTKGVWCMVEYLRFEKEFVG